MKWLLRWNIVCLFSPQLPRVCWPAQHLLIFFMCACVCKDTDVMKLAPFSSWERHALIFVKAQMNKHTYMQTHWDKSSGRMADAGASSSCVCERNAWRFLQDIISIWDWLCNDVMSKKREWGQNNLLRHWKETMTGLFATQELFLGRPELFSFCYLSLLLTWSACFLSDRLCSDFTRNITLSRCLALPLTALYIQCSHLIIVYMAVTLSVTCFSFHWEYQSVFRSCITRCNKATVTHNFLTWLLHQNSREWHVFTSMNRYFFCCVWHVCQHVSLSVVIWLETNIDQSLAG